MKKRGKELQRHLLTATSYMIPFLVAGGIIYSLAILLNGSTAFPADSILYKLILSVRQDLNYLFQY